MLITASNKTRRRSAATMSGFSLLEALVSIIILSIGLLGVAALQGVGLRATSGANHRSQAAWLATQMIEEARTQRANVVAQDAGIVGVLAAVPCGAVTANAINAWRARIACTLPSGRGAVAYAPVLQTLTVVVEWDDQRGVDSLAAGGATTTNFTLQSAL